MAMKKAFYGLKLADYVRIEIISILMLANFCCY